MSILIEIASIEIFSLFLYRPDFSRWSL